MDLLPFGKLSPYKTRSLVPVDLALDDWKVIEPFFDDLQKRITACQSVTDLEAWVLEVSELSAILDE